MRKDVWIITQQSLITQPTVGQTTFTGNDNDSESLSYTGGQIDVYLNGSHLNQTDDYVDNKGTSVVLQSRINCKRHITYQMLHGTVN